MTDEVIVAIPDPNDWKMDKHGVKPFFDTAQVVVARLQSQREG
jgi:hypothetical protein